MGLRELRQNASELVRRAEQGETFVVTVSGRPVAELGPVGKPQWVNASALAELWRYPADETWEHDRRYFDDDPRDPWST